MGSSTVPNNRTRRSSRRDRRGNAACGPQEFLHPGAVGTAKSHCPFTLDLRREYRPPITFFSTVAAHSFVGLRGGFISLQPIGDKQIGPNSERLNARIEIAEHRQDV